MVQSIRSRFSDFKSDSKSNPNSNHSESIFDATGLNGAGEFDVLADDEVSDGLQSEKDQLDSVASGGFGNFHNEGSEGLRSGIPRCFLAAAGPSSNSNELDSVASGEFGNFHDVLPSLPHRSTLYPTLWPLLVTHLVGI